jgi:hypothetical protein
VLALDVVSPLVGSLEEFPNQKYICPILPAELVKERTTGKGKISLPVGEYEA